MMPIPEAYLSHPQQAGGVWRYRLDDGPGLGMRVWHLHGYGWDLQLLPDRGLDCAAATWQGRNLSWLSPSGLTDPAAYDPRGLGWLRSFTGGLLSTCGPGWFGPPEQDQVAEFGLGLGLHGRFHITPASELSSRSSHDADGDLIYEVSGMIRDAVLFGPQYVTERVWRLGPGGPTVFDRVRNVGHTPAPLCLLYHCNFGYPLLGPETQLHLQAQQTEARDAHSARQAAWQYCKAPAAQYTEDVRFHTLLANTQGEASAQLRNPQWQCNLRWNARSMPVLTQWRCFEQGTYVCGLEPGTSAVRARSELRSRNELPLLDPGGEQSFFCAFHCSLSNET